PANRNHNINLAMQAINNQVINPGENWSFNRAVGPRTAERGYKKAMIIVNKKFVPGLGGGVCQVASTLYNVILQAKFQVIERHPHSLPVKYVASGCDATVSYGAHDLKFSNNLPHQVVIKTSSLPGKILIAFYTRKTQPAADPVKQVNIPIDMP
ncbi:MAG: VanW family protein, partial [Chitinophagales bacterium]